MTVHNLNSSTGMSGFYIAYRSSCILDKPEDRGLTHLLEHIICRRIGPLLSVFSQYGIDFNALTSDDYVVFYIAGLDEYIREFRDKFFLLVTSRKPLVKDDLEAERPIILQEYNDHFSDPYMGTFSNGLRRHYNYYGPIGQRFCIEAAQLDVLQALYDRKFSKPSIVVNVSKTPVYDIGEQDYEDSRLLNNSLSYKESYDVEYESGRSDRVLLIGLKEPIPNEALIHTQMLNYLLCGDIQKPLYHLLREEYGLCYGADISEKVIGDCHLSLFSSQVNLSSRDLVKNIFINLIDEAENYLTRDLYEKAIEHFLVKRKMQRIARYNNVTDIFYPNLMRDGALEGMRYENILDHWARYYKGASDRLVMYD